MLRGMAGSAGAKVIFIWWQTAELSNHALLRVVSPISALSYQGRLGRPVVTMVTVPKICSYTLKGWDSSFSSMRITLPGTAVVLHEVLLSHDKKKKHLHRACFCSAVTDVPGHVFAGAGLHGNGLFGFNNLKVKLGVCLALCLRLFPLLWGDRRGTRRRDSEDKIRSVNVVLDKKKKNNKKKPTGLTSCSFCGETTGDIWHRGQT